MEISQKTKEKIGAIAKLYDLKLLVLFGSQATKQTHKMSDVDVGYLADRFIDYQENYQIVVALAKIFKYPSIELVNIENVPPALKKQIADHGVILFETAPNIFDEFAIRANRSYLETKPLRLYRQDYIKNFLQKYA